MSRHLFALLLLCSSAAACNIPVFRYALERWTADPIELVVFHRGPLSPAHTDQLAAWERLASPTGQANLQIFRHDVTDFSASTPNTTAPLPQDIASRRQLWLSLPAAAQANLPCVIARSRHGRDRTINHWISPLDEAAERLAESPARTELIRRLQQGHSIVWLIVNPATATPDSPSAKLRETARSQLAEKCRSLPNQLELPEGIGLPGSELYSEVPLLLKFSTLEINAADTRETYLLRQISGLQPEAWAAGEPLIVPVFGRGRALEVIPASKLSPELIHDLTQFLCSACSCQVKEQNPGFDLLLNSNWNHALFGEDGELPPPPEPGPRSQSQSPSQTPNLLPIPPGRK